jgi:hypothetical protein
MLLKRYRLNKENNLKVNYVDEMSTHKEVVESRSFGSRLAAVLAVTRAYLGLAVNGKGGN